MDSLFNGDFNNANGKLTEQNQEILTSVPKQTIPHEWMAQFEIGAKQLIEGAQSNNLPAVVAAVAALERTLYHLGGLSNQEMVDQVHKNSNGSCSDENFSSGNYL